MTDRRLFLTKKVGYVLAVILFVQLSVAHDVQSYVLKTPAGWRSEIIPFPIDFAPDIKYTGVEELRFSPGMFDSTSETHFTYVFIWWLDGRQEINEKTLSSDLEYYFRGLCSTISEGKNSEYEPDRIQADIKESERKIISDRTDHKFFLGTVHTYDAFTDWKLLNLNFEIHSWYCADLKKTAAFFCISPKPADAQIWHILRDIGKSVHCGQD
jgi:hypothetical protein